MAIFWVAALLLAFVGSIWIYFQLKFRYLAVPLKCIPPSVPFGNLALFAPEPLKGFQKFYDAVDPENGLGAIWMFAQQTVIVTRPEDVKKVFAASAHRIDDVRSVHARMFLGEKSLTQLKFDEWSAHRRLTQKAFQYTRFSDMTTQLVANCSELVDYLLERVGEEVDVSVLLKMMTLDAIGESAFGFRFNSIRALREGRRPNRVAEAFEYMGAELTRRAYSLNPLELFYNLPTASNRQHRAAREIVRNTIREMIEERLRTGNKEGRADLLQSILDVSGEDKKDGVDVESVVDELITLLFAGYDTTSVTVTFAIYELAKKPDILSKVRDEVSAVLGDRDPSFEDVNRLQYCSLVIKETLRMHPPAPLTTRNVFADLELGTPTNPVIVPKGTLVWLLMMSVQNDPRNFPEPGRFDPERFRETPDQGAWFPFSAGLRNCVGQKFAMLEATMTLAMLCRKYTFRLAPGYVMQPTMSGFVRKPKDGLKVVVEAA